VKNRSSGFTLVELMVVVMLVALLGLVATQIPLFSLRSWTKGSERLKLQRDANLVMITIQRRLRPENSSIYDKITPSENLSELIIDGESFGLEDDDDDTVALFDVTTTDEVINVSLKLEKKNVGSIILRTAVKPRN